MVIKSKIFIKCNVNEFGYRNFRKDLISNFNGECVFLVGDYHTWSFTKFERKSVGFEPIINSYQFPIHSGMNIVNVTVGCRTVVSSAKWTKRIWFEDLCMSMIYKRKSIGPNTDPCGTPNVMLDIENCSFWLRHIVSYTQIRLKQALHHTSCAIMKEVSPQY